MTEFEFYTSITLVTLLIVGLMWWMKGEFRKMAMTPEEKIDNLIEEYEKYMKFLESERDWSKPKRRKYRDNPARGK